MIPERSKGLAGPEVKTPKNLTQACPEARMPRGSPKLLETHIPLFFPSTSYVGLCGFQDGAQGVLHTLRLPDPRVCMLSQELIEST